MLVPAEVIRRAERFKSSIAITPLPDACHWHRDTERSAPAIPEPEGNTTSQHPISGLDKHLPSTKGCWKMETEGFAAGVWKRTRFSHSEVPLPIFPHTSTTASASHLSTWPPTTCIPPGKVHPHGMFSPLSLAETFWDSKTHKC